MQPHSLSCRSLRIPGLMTMALLLSLAALQPAAAQPLRDGEVERGIWRLDGMDPDLPLDDLEPFRQILEGAQVVGLGETIHTSGGYYTMKHRLFRFLVERMGFRAFAIESPWAGANFTGQYVATCQGTPQNAVRGLFTVWQSAEVAGMVEWMCSWNQAHPDDPITFFGFDIQQPGFDGPSLISYLGAFGVPADDPVLAGLRRCDGVAGPSQRGRVTEENHQACLAALDAAEVILNEHDPSDAIQTAHADVEWAKVHLIGLRAWQGQAFYDGRDFYRSWNTRDRGMATVFQRIRQLRVGSAKTAIWAHNIHVARNSLYTLLYHTMGTHLGDEMGHQYASTALVAYNPSIAWAGVGCGPRPTFSSSVEWHLQPLGEPFLLVDLDANGTNPAHPPYLDPAQPRLVGYNWYFPGLSFNALVYLESSPAMTPLAWPGFCP